MTTNSLDKLALELACIYQRDAARMYELAREHYRDGFYYSAKRVQKTAAFNSLLARLHATNESIPPIPESQK